MADDTHPVHAPFCFFLHVLGPTGEEALADWSSGSLRLDLETSFILCHLILVDLPRLRPVDFIIFGLYLYY